MNASIRRSMESPILIEMELRGQLEDDSILEEEEEEEEVDASSRRETYENL